VILTPRTRGESRRAAVALIAAAALALAAQPSIAAAQPPSRLTWGAPALIDPAAAVVPTTPGGIQSISCPSVSLCVAVDGLGNVLTTTEPATPGAWRALRVDGHIEPCHSFMCAGLQTLSCPNENCGSLARLACPSVSLCVLWDDAGWVYTSTDPGSATPSWNGEHVGEAVDLSCASASLCVAVDGLNDVLASTDPTSGSSTWHLARVDAAPCLIECLTAGPGPLSEVGNLNAISCPAATLCVAGDWQGRIVASAEPAGGAPTWHSAYMDQDATWRPLHPRLQTPILAISCPSASLCFAGDESGQVLASQDPLGGPAAWQAEQAIPPGYLWHAVSPLDCPSATRCVGLEQIGYGVPQSAPDVYESTEPSVAASWTPATIDTSSVLSAISCPSEGLCVVVDRAGDAIVGRALPPPPAPQAHGRATFALALAGRTSIRTLLRRGLLTMRVTAPAAGTVVIHVLTPWAPAHPPAGQHVIAAGRYTFRRAASAIVDVRLARPGRALLRHARRFALTVHATFTPSSGRPTSRTAALRLTR
jgi:hypothetical protein